MGTKDSNGLVARQTFKTEKTCKYVVRFQPDGAADVGGSALDDITSSIYLDKRLLDRLGNPEKVVVTVEAAK